MKKLTFSSTAQWMTTPIPTMTTSSLFANALIATTLENYFFVPERSPTVQSLGQNAFQKFLKNQNRYLHRVSDAQSFGSTYSSPSLTALVNVVLLQSQSLLKKLEILQNIDDFTEVGLLNRLEEQFKHD